MSRSIVLSLLAFACSGDEAKDTDTPVDTDTGTVLTTDTAPSTTDTGTAPLLWADMDFAQRSTYMNDVVMPTVKPLFEAYDPRFSTMDCATCHGAGALDQTFAMPNDGAPAIDVAMFPTGLGADFMMDTVVPTMVDLLDADPFNPTDYTGFGCFSCHATL